MRILTVVALFALGCGGSVPPARTEHERDSTIAQSRLPGATAVKAALKIGDSAAARQARVDSGAP